MKTPKPFRLILYFAILNCIKGVTHDFCYKATRRNNFNCENIYIWKSDQKDFISLLHESTKPEGSDLKALKGKIVKVIADNMKPYIISSNTSKEISGYLGDIWNTVEEALNFKSNITSVNYDAGLNIISKGNADVMLGAGVVKRSLIGVIYSQPYLYNWYHLYIKQPEARASSSSYIKTLNGDLWIVSVLIFSILTVSLWLTIKFLNSKFGLEPFVSLPSCFLSVCSGFLNQGFDLRITSYSGRMIILFSLIPGYVLYSAFNAVLVAKLAISVVHLPFNSVADLQEQGNLPFCLRTNSFVYNNFTYNVNGSRMVKQRWKGILNGRGCLDLNNQTNLAQIICKNNVAVLENRVVMATVVQNFKINCSISFLNRRYFSTGNSYLVYKGFRRIEPIETVIKHMKSVGVLKRLEDKWIKNDINIMSDIIQQAPKLEVTLHHISGIMMFYASMVVISVLILLIEIIVDKYMTKENNKDTHDSLPGIIQPFVN